MHWLGVNGAWNGVSFRTLTSPNADAIQAKTRLRLPLHRKVSLVRPAKGAPPGAGSGQPAVSTAGCRWPVLTRRLLPTRSRGQTLPATPSAGAKWPTLPWWSSRTLSCRPCYCHVGGPFREDVHSGLGPSASHPSDSASATDRTLRAWATRRSVNRHRPSHPARLAFQDGLDKK